ncbi:hypothetical protein JOD43_000813 [Pullulanibacillus pueri]|uniref:Uncharacterized protein n=1 Tax=Pullulanibacillus pueri TaxID=1437324 RepID=A0A8J3ENA3_9BACL|nr:hypothetical protein [Pullulanibacillus pueri]GGH83845.1 hypothetical protein GCM10007096_25550 [Pullulanibacillus pueri]
MEHQQKTQHYFTKSDVLMNVAGVAIVAGIIALALEINPF